MDKIDILSLDEKQLESELISLGAPKYRAAQVFDWLHNKCVKSFEEMTNIPKSLLLQLSDNFVIIHCTVEKKQKSMYDSTVKYLFSLSDGDFIESVVMKYKYGNSICVSTQIGCKMGCTFCASGIFGYRRNLTPSEMLLEVYTAQKDLGIKISHIVLMGMGEPLDNYDNVIKFLRLISSTLGQNISMRRITISTSGVVPKIYELAKLNLGVTLSVSLHAPNDEIRSSIMPINKRWGIKELIAACRFYTKATSRRITFEYTMISGVNDSDECGRELSKLLKGLMCHINLIPVSEVLGKDNIKSNQKRIEAFYLILTNNGLNVTIRRSLGDDIDASCGQLRMNTINDKEQTRK